MDSLAISGATSHTPERSDELWRTDANAICPIYHFTTHIFQHQTSDSVSNDDYKKYLRIGFILLAVLLLLDVDPPEPTTPFPEGLLEFISADF